MTAYHWVYVINIAFELTTWKPGSAWRPVGLPLPYLCSVCGGTTFTSPVLCDGSTFTYLCPVCGGTTFTLPELCDAWCVCSMVGHRCMKY